MPEDDDGHNIYSLLRANRSRLLWSTLRQAQKIVRLRPVGFCLDVLVPILADSHDDANIAQAYADIELPFATFYVLNGFLLRDPPTLTLIVYPTNVSDPFMRGHAVRFVDTEDLVSHFLSYLQCCAHEVCYGHERFSLV